MIQSIFSSYDNFKEDIPHRYFPPERVEAILKEHGYCHEIIGKSFEDRPIYKLSMGKGNIKILFWAQMHGNESTASRAMFDLWKLLHANQSKWIKSLLSRVQIDFIPQLNPDGAAYYTRRNAANIDINRDFLAEQSPEIRVLKSNITNVNYNFLFNLHDQRTIFHPKGIQKPATLSFLAPAVDDTNKLKPNSLISRKLISSMIHDLSQYIPHQIARFTHEFYPKATGDNFQRLGYPTILIECGHYPNDYKRNQTRKYTFLSFLYALDAIQHHTWENLDVDIYQKTPPNDTKALDIIFKNVQLKKGNQSCAVDIGIQYEEILKENDLEISFMAKIVEIGDLHDYFAHDICHAENRVFKNNSNLIPKIGEIANFQLGEWKIENGKIIK